MSRWSESVQLLPAWSLRVKSGAAITRIYPRLRSAPTAADTVGGVRSAIRILALVVLGAVAFVTAGQYAPDGSWIQTASDQFLRALRVSWMIDPIAR